MGAILKERYSKEFYNKFCEIIGEVVPVFNTGEFMQLIFDETWHTKELKQRMRHTTLVLSKFLPADFTGSLPFIKEIIIKLKKEKIREASLEYMFLADYIEIFGINHFDESVESMEFVTQFTSCEFAVRPFIIKYGKRMLIQMFEWAKHESPYVRRLASEGTRPRLPWAMALPELIKNPSPILPLLENLKNDPSEFVRRSVANNLNDIAKDNPGVVIEIARNWKGNSKETDALIKHGCRTLLKKGNKEILSHFGFENETKILAENLKIISPIVKTGENLEFTFTLFNPGRQKQKIRLEYGLYYLKNKGHLSKKIFKISERELKPLEKATVARSHSFKTITTRKFYAGTHKVSIIVNGREQEISQFELTV